MLCAPAEVRVILFPMLGGEWVVSECVESVFARVLPKWINL